VEVLAPFSRPALKGIAPCESFPRSRKPFLDRSGDIGPSTTLVTLGRGVCEIGASRVQERYSLNR
jgi:hypothetical protein